MSSTVADFDFDFFELVDDAQSNASTDWEMSFVAEFAQKLNAFGDRTFVSPRQLDCLTRIAGWD